MYCTKCGKQMEGKGKLCPQCVAAEKAKYQAEQTAEMCAEFKEVFIEEDEKYIASLGDGYLLNFIMRKGIQSMLAILTNERLYLFGNLWDANEDGLAHVNVQKTIDLEDITGTGFVFSSPKIHYLFLGIASFVGIPLIMSLLAEDTGLAIGVVIGLIVGLVFLAKYFMNRFTDFVIEYAGGCIKFDASLCGIEDSKDFEREIRKAKNKLKKRK